MKKYQYLASWDDQTLTRVGEPVVVLGDSNVSQVEVTLPSDFLLDPTKAECRMYFLLPGEKESAHDVLETATKDDNGDSHVTWTIKHVHSQKGGRLAFSLTLIGDDVQWDSRTAIIPVYESRYQPESEETEEPYTGRLDALEGSMAAIRGEFAEVQEDFEDLKETATLGTPIPESLVANMQEGHVYIYTGTEPGYTAGHVYYYVGGVLTDGGQYGGTAVDATLSQSGMAADAAVVGAEVSAIKEDLSAIQTATAEDAGKALKAKTVTNGKVTEWEFGDAGGADPETIKQAVTDWLDEHPEATTTVEDRSITEAKLATALVPTLKNNYVTPEMFGAVGDGATDDTQAIRNMFASDNIIFWFPSKTYLVNGSIDVTKTCDIYFNTTTIDLGSTSEVRDFDYVIGFKTLKISTYGTLNVTCRKAVNIGILLESCGGSNFDVFRVSGARIWGISMAEDSNGNNSINFNRIACSQCGYKINAKAKRLGDKKLEITNMTSTQSTFSNVADSIFDNRYYQCEFVIDDSGYTKSTLHNRLVFAHDRGSWGSNPFVLDAEDKTKGTFEFVTSGANVPSDYTPTEGETRDVFIPVGGGVNLFSHASEGVISINYIATQSNAIGFRFQMGYAGHIGCYVSEYDTMMMISNALMLNINSLYAEATGNGYLYKFNNAYDKILLFKSFDDAKVFVNSYLGQVPKQGNSIVNGQTFGSLNQNQALSLQCSDFLAYKKLTGQNWMLDGQANRFQVDENSPRLITVDSEGYNFSYTVKIGLTDLLAYYTNSFEPMIFFVRRRNATKGDNFIFALTDELINNGYTIHGAVDGILIVHPSEYNNHVKITVILFRSTSTFFVTAEPLTFVDNTQTVNT